MRYFLVMASGISNSGKRQRPDDSDRDSSSDSETEIRQKSKKAGLDSWPRFLVVDSGDESLPLSGLSPFVINKWFEGISRTGFKSVKRLRSGQFLVECSSEKASRLLQGQDGCQCVDRPVQVTRHKSLNSCKGVIRCPDLQGMTELGIKTELQDQGVTDVYRVSISKEGKKIPTNTYFLTFCLSSLPEFIKVGYVRVRVSLFTPKPLRCFNCQRFGHGARFCKGQKCCHICAKDHEENACSGTSFCVNCKGSHPSSSKTCPEFKTECDIQRYKATNRCSFFDAKRAVRGAPQSFASVLKQSAPAQQNPARQDPPSSGSDKTLEKLFDLVAKLAGKFDELERQVKALTAEKQSARSSVSDKQLSYSAFAGQSQSRSSSDKGASGGMENPKASSSQNPSKSTGGLPSGLPRKILTPSTSAKGGGAPSSARNKGFGSDLWAGRSKVSPRKQKAPTANRYSALADEGS